jgi:hypothetical protein
MHAIQGCVFRKTDMARPACGSKLASGGRQDKTEISSALKHSDSEFAPTGGLAVGGNLYVPTISVKLSR